MLQENKRTLRWRIKRSRFRWWMGWDWRSNR